MLPFRRYTRACGVLLAASCAIGCGSAHYQVVTPSGAVVQDVSADAPGGDSFVMVVYYGPKHTPIVQAGADSTALVDATAEAGRKAVELALKAAK